MLLDAVLSALLVAGLVALIHIVWDVLANDDDDLPPGACCP